MIENFLTPDDVAEAAAERIAELSSKAYKNSKPFHLVLSGGSTPKLVFQKLVKDFDFSEDIQKNTHLWFGDERSVPNDHEDSNVKMAYDYLVSACKIPEANIHKIDGGAQPLAAEARKYGDEIEKHVPKGPNGLPAFDLIMLGMGDDGHTASLFPGTSALEEMDKLVVSNIVPQKNTSRLTMTYPLINAANEIMIIVTGAAKAKVMSEIIPEGSGKYPIEKITGNGNNVNWYVDDNAMKMVQ